MSRFSNGKYSTLVPYTPGEQPQNRKYIKLNTNESPFPASGKAFDAAREELHRLQLYPDPDCTELCKTAAKELGVSENEIIFNNGSDETLNFAFMAFCDSEHGAVFPDITYGFYSVFAELNGVPYETKPLREDYTINADDYIGVNKTVFIANPNAPTGIALPLSEIERIVASNPDNVVVIDEAYVDFGAQSAVSLTKKYDNLLVVQTFSKSRSLAGARLGFGVANPEIIKELNAIRFSTNPYNINRVTMAAGIGALRDTEYFERTKAQILKNRAYTVNGLKALGFEVLDSKTNFVFARTPKMSGLELYRILKEDKGILVRHFEKPRLSDFNRITIGAGYQMERLICEITNILK